MNWENERYVRLYVRDTGEWNMLSWDAQALLMQLLRKADRAGVLQLGKMGRRVLPATINHKDQAARIDPALDELLADGCVQLHDTYLVIPNFLSAQEAKQSDRLRQQESRARRRELAIAGHDLDGDVTKRDGASHGVTDCHDESQGVTDGHGQSHPVTPSVPSCAKPNREGPPASGTDPPLPPPVSTESARAAIIRFREKSADDGGTERFGYLTDPKGQPQPVEVERFRSAMERTGATQTDLDEMAGRIGRGEEYGNRTHVACSMLCQSPGRHHDRVDYFAELLMKARTPPRAPKNGERVPPASPTPVNPIHCPPPLTEAILRVREARAAAAREGKT